MPTYEKYDGDGNVVERSVTFRDTLHDVQLSTISSMTDSPWHLVDANGERVKLDPTPVFIAPSEQDAGPDSPVPAIDPPHVDDGELRDIEPDESGDHTEE